MKKNTSRSRARKGIRLTKKAEDVQFVYSSRPRTQHYRPSGVHEDFQCLVNSSEAAEAHKFLKAAAALEGVPMVRLHKLSAATKRKLKAVVGDNKKLPITVCREIMKDLVGWMVSDLKNQL